MASKQKTAPTAAPKPTAKSRKANQRRPEAQAEPPPAAAGMPTTETAPVAGTLATEAAHAETPAAAAALPATPAAAVPPAADAPTRAPKKRVPRSAPTPARPAAEPLVGAVLPRHKLSALDAAARVLAETGQPMNCQALIATMADKGYWTSPAGRTPSATLYAAILKEVTTKGEQSRFRKVDRGLFARNA